VSVEKYDLISGEHLTTFEFVSEGLKGKISKIIQFTPANYHNVYNLGFGDKDLMTGEIDDTVVSNNGDSEKVLGTVVASLYIFTDKNPDALIYAIGSTKSRSRLYQIGITKFIEKAKEDFIIYGQIQKEWYLFEKNINYDAFLVKRIKRQ
jgi:hypothetical protein